MNKATDTPLILHVDDEDDILTITKLALEAVGNLRVVQCSSGRDAIEIAADLAPDLILLDVMMPDIDGVETMRRLRKMPGFKDIPIIFLTAKVTLDDQQRLLECGDVSIIKKPFDAMTLAADIIGVWKDSFQKRMQKRIAFE